MDQSDPDGFEARRAAGHPPVDDENFPIRLTIEGDALVLEFPVPVQGWRIPFGDVQAFTDSLIDAVNGELESR